jgi:hypothetical protein
VPPGTPDAVMAQTGKKETDKIKIVLETFMSKNLLILNLPGKVKAF